MKNSSQSSLAWWLVVLIVLAWFSFIVWALWHAAF